MANQTTRRSFLHTAAGAATVAALADQVLASTSDPSAAGVPTRKLGRTGEQGDVPLTVENDVAATVDIVPTRPSQ